MDGFWRLLVQNSSAPQLFKKYQFGSEGLIGNMNKASLLLMIVTGGVMMSCEKKDGRMTVVSVSYSHSDDLGNVTQEYRMLLGDEEERKRRSVREIISLADQRSIEFTTTVDVTDPDLVRVSVESTMDGFSTDRQILDFHTGSPHPLDVVFNNGLRVSAQVGHRPLLKVE